MSLMSYIKQSDKKGITKNANVNIVSDISNELIGEIQKNQYSYSLYFPKFNKVTIVYYPDIPFE